MAAGRGMWLAETGLFSSARRTPPNETLVCEFRLEAGPARQHWTRLRSTWQRENWRAQLVFLCLTQHQLHFIGQAVPT